MPTSPRVSVIIPAFNAAHCLSSCIESIQRQSLSSWEAIIVNDGSTDETAQVARAYAGDNFRYLEQANAGQGAARNAGLGIASGEFIAFLDADDYWNERFLSATVGFLDAHPEAVAVSTAFLIRFADGTEQRGPVFPRLEDVPTAPLVLHNFFEFWAEHQHLHTGTILIRKSIVDRAGFQRADLRISQDLEYWAYIGTFGTWGFIPEPLWVANSQAAAVAVGWRSKYKGRRALCPDIQEWQSRVRPRITSDHLPSFRIIRGRVAAGLLHHMILGGLSGGARRLIRDHGSEMPPNKVVRLMRLADRCGQVVWNAACSLVSLLEFVKAARLGRLWKASAS